MNLKNLTLGITALLIVAGIVISGITLYEHLLHEFGTALGIATESTFCPVTANFNCHAVIGSAYGKFLGITLSSWGLAFYGALGLLVFVGFYQDLLSRRALADVLLLGTLGGLLGSIALFLISKFKIGQLCPLCLATYGVNAALFICAWLLGRENPFFTRLASALRDAIAFLGALFPRNAEMRSGVAWLAVLAYCLWLLSLRLLPQHLTLHYVEPVLQQSQEKQGESQELQRWAEGKEDDLQLRLNQGAFGDYAIGPKDAPIVVVAFSDFECPACRSFHEMLRPIKEKYAGQMLFVHKNFPLDKACNSLMPSEFHLHACFAAEFARCAGEQNKFWEAADFLYQYEGLEEERTKEEVRTDVMSRAGSLGLDAAAIDECLSSGRQRAPIERDIATAGELGLEGTPSFWVNGKKFGASNVATFEAAFSQILAGQ